MIPDSPRILILGQAPPLKLTEEPFARSRLYGWLETIGLSKSDALKCFTFSALVDTFPGSARHGHLPPNRQQIAESRPRLVAEIRALNPGAVIPVGIMAIRELLGTELALDSCIGNIFHQNPFQALQRGVPIVPLPHPSGASPWVHLGQNGQKLNAALALLQVEIEKVMISRRLAHKRKTAQ